MRNAAIVSAAFMASSALAFGTANVVNKCSFPAYVANTPDGNSGYETDFKDLMSGDTYTKTYIPFNTGGWAVKLSKIQGQWPNDTILQWEYNNNESPKLWYDLSAVNGDPWAGDWEISNDSGNNCGVKQTAYQHSTDDANGMQDLCTDSTSITVTLCPDGGDGGGSGSGSGSGAGSSVVSSVVSSTTSSTSVDPAAYTPVVEAADETTVATVVQTTAVAQESQWSGRGHNRWGNRGPPGKREADAAPTTLATRVATEVPSAQVTAVKRHEHRARHPRQRLE